VPEIEPLSPLEVDTLWSLVDYSTMSNSAHVAQICSNSDPNFWFDINASWYDLFGGVNTADFASFGIGSAVVQAPISETATQGSVVNQISTGWYNAS
jgi:hypothetical protein